MKIGIIDAELISNKHHRFPNLACMKISGYYKENSENRVSLITNYNNVINNSFDKIFISKVFTKTKIPNYIINMSNVTKGGTGFYYDKAKPLVNKIEHHMPDYNLYNEWINKKIKEGAKDKHFTYYKDYSIGYTTRGCFRKCSFCVNRRYNKVHLHSPLKEFVKKDRKYICLLDDNILGYSEWKYIFLELQKTNKRFQYKQGMDIRLMTDKKAKIITKSKYMGDYIFAFDNINDSEIIKDKLKLWNKYKNKTTKLYVFCGFDPDNKYNEEFWINDIKGVFDRIKILMSYQCIPYIMRYYKYQDSPYRGTYINIARWCNQVNIFKKKSYQEFIMTNANQSNSNKECATLSYYKIINKKYPSIMEEYNNIKYED